MKPVLGLFIMIDAMGWEILRNDSFGQDFAPVRKRLDSVFGYSSTCVPSILSGRWPVQHRNWCYFVHDPANSPFKWLRSLRWLPKAVTSRRTSSDRVSFKVRVWDGNRHNDIALWSLCGPGDNGEPVITILLQGED